MDEITLYLSERDLSRLASSGRYVIKDSVMDKVYVLKTGGSK